MADVAAKFRWERAVILDSRAGHWMREFQVMGMEEEAAQLGVGAAPE
jgi:hypothetical protein